MQSSACWFLSLFLHLALRFLNQTFKNGGEGRRCKTRVSQEPPPPPQPFAVSRGNGRACPYIHICRDRKMCTYIYIHTHTYPLGSPSFLHSPALDRGSDVLPGLPRIPRAPVPLGFSTADLWPLHSPPATPRRSPAPLGIICGTLIPARAQHFRLLFSLPRFFLFPPAPSSAYSTPEPSRENTKVQKRGQNAWKPAEF